MDDDVLLSQCTDIAKSINALKLTLSEADGEAGIAKVVTEVLNLIRSFRSVAKLYVSELLKKCRELERKEREFEDLEDLSRKQCQELQRKERELQNLSRKLQEVLLESRSGSVGLKLEHSLDPSSAAQRSTNRS